MARKVHMLVPRGDAVFCGATGNLDVTNEAKETTCTRCIDGMSSIGQQIKRLWDRGWRCGKRPNNPKKGRGSLALPRKKR